MTGLALGDVVGLEELIGSDGIQVGDKIFADFAITGDVTAEQVDVVAIQDQYGFGLSFRGGFNAIGGATTDFQLSFSVEVAPESQQLITDVHLGFNGQFIGAGFAEVVEQVRDGGPIPQGNLLGQMYVSNPPPVFEATLLLEEPLRKIWTIKDVQLSGGAAVDGNRRLNGDSDVNRATISIIDQTFSQIPEPSTVLLVAAALFGLCLTGRRSH